MKYVSLDKVKEKIDYLLNDMVADPSDYCSNGWNLDNIIYDLETIDISTYTNQIEALKKCLNEAKYFVELIESLEGIVKTHHRENATLWLNQYKELNK